MAALLPDYQWDVLGLLLATENPYFGDGASSTFDRIISRQNTLIEFEPLSKILQDFINRIHESPDDSDLQCRVKSEYLSSELRIKGNVSFKKGLIAHSYEMYCKSVILAPWTGKNFPLALGNRSAALFHMEKYEKSISDIKLALEYGYPSYQRYKLFLRGAECYICLADVINAELNLNLAVENLEEESPISAESQKDFYKKLDIVEKRLSSLKSKGSSSSFKEETFPMMTKAPNRNFIYASSAIMLEKTETQGRRVVAVEDIQRGDVLFVEKPYAFVPIPHEEGIILNACDNCCQNYINPIPCSICSVTVYCTDECRSEAWDKFHRWECQGCQNGLWNMIGIGHLAVRTLLISTSSGFPNKSNETRKFTAKELLVYYSEGSGIDCYKPTREGFYRMFNLLSNIDKMDLVDYNQYSVNSLMLMLYLKTKSDYFDYLQSNIHFEMDFSELQLFVSSLLVLHMTQLIGNAHSINEIGNIHKGKPLVPVKSNVCLATAIYPSTSMMNHSCNPNIINNFYKSTLIVKAVRSIPKGSEVFNCYGLNYMRDSYEDRQQCLKAQYYFACACDACSDPEKADFISYSCHKCKGPVVITDRKAICKQCKITDHKLQDMHSIIGRADELTKQASLSTSFQEKCSKLTQALKLRQQCLHRHHIEIRKNIDELAQLYTEEGEYSKSIELIKQNIPTLEHQYGSFSIEVAHELEKLSDALYSRVMNATDDMRTELRAWCMESQKITRKAIQLFNLNCGPLHESLESLKAKEKIVDDMLAENVQSNNLELPSIHNLVHYNLKI